MTSSQQEQEKEQPNSQPNAPSPTKSKRTRLPILDYHKWLAADHNKSREQFVEELRWACHNIGFFLLQNHDISAKTAFSETRRFFQRPEWQKQLISYEQSSNFRGYMRLGVENTAGRMDCREQVEYAVEQPVVVRDETSDGPGDPKFLFYNRLRGTNPWPDDFQPSLRPVVLDLAWQYSQVAENLRQALCLALGLPPTALDEYWLDDNGNNKSNDNDKQQQSLPQQECENINDTLPEPLHWVLKLVSYPTAILTEHQQHEIAADKEIKRESHKEHDKELSKSLSPSSSSSPIIMLGVGSHTDTNFLTLILAQQQKQKAREQHPSKFDEQDRNGGLQVFFQGEWRNVVLPTDQNNNDYDSNNELMICNLGEQAQIWSRNYSLATPHRVLLATRQSSSSTTTATIPTTETSSDGNPRLKAEQDAADTTSSTSTPLLPTTTSSNTTVAFSSSGTGRISLPFFYNPRLSACIRPAVMPSSSSPPWERTESQHDPVIWQEEQQRRRRGDTQLQSVGENTFKSLARSHPMVFARHHADLKQLDDGRIIPVAGDEKCDNDEKKNKSKKQV
ncbi:hypothetical protein ACA910_020981 [Epithemia clementina (nom. ined.)]